MSGAMNTGGFASLSSTLLARKGGARPAMRSSHGASLDDLGWNDMGEDRPAAPSPLAAAIPQPIKYQEVIAEEFSAEPEQAKPVAVAKPSAVVRPIRAVSRVTRKPELAVGKVAFTLRLDAERHLRLRLATAVGNRSAQKIVLDALDAYLAAHPELDELAEQVPSRKAEGRN
jgi:uncharacterized protein YlxP (DUF503 family)